MEALPCLPGRIGLPYLFLAFRVLELDEVSVLQELQVLGELRSRVHYLVVIPGSQSLIVVCLSNGQGPSLFQIEDELLVLGPQEESEGFGEGGLKGVGDHVGVQGEVLAVGVLVGITGPLGLVLAIIDHEVTVVLHEHPEVLAFTCLVGGIYNSLSNGVGDLEAAILY